MATKVSLVKCSSYNQAEVDQAVHRALELIGGLQAFVQPGQKVLLKPNVLMGSHPDSAVTTHPSIVSAVVKEVVRAGATAWVGDSPGNASAHVPKIMEDSGIKKATEAAGGKIVYFQQEGIAEINSPSNNRKMKKYKIARAVLEADVVINLPKLKTHNFTLFTGAIKNMFGSVPGFEKGHFHITAPQPRDFAELIVDVFEITRPKLNIVDAVMGMEGHGPTGGRPRKLGVILASSDAVAVDAVGAYLIGYPPSQIETTLVAQKRKLGESRIEHIQALGASIDEVKQTDWKLSTDVNRITRWIPDFIYTLVRPLARQVRIDPVIDQSKCTRCLICVKNCPAQTIRYDKGRKLVEINLKNCINCFCCHELCEFKAIKLKRSWLAKRLGIGYD